MLQLSNLNQDIHLMRSKLAYVHTLSNIYQVIEPVVSKVCIWHVSLYTIYTYM